MRRKWFTALLIGAMMCITAACGAKQEQGSVDAPDKEQEASAEHPEGTEEQLRRNAYADALMKLREEKIFPDGSAAEYDQTMKISESTFAVYDIDGDGREELLVKYMGPYYGSLVAKIYDYDIGQKIFKEEISEFPSVTFYGNGIIEAEASHNHGLASDSDDFWPYTLYEYDKESDTYKVVAQVDGWTKTFAEEHDGILFPDEIDEDGDGLVYLIMAGEYNLKEAEMMDRKAYEAWRASYLKGASEAEILSWEYLTEENIMAMCAGE